MKSSIYKARARAALLGNYAVVIGASILAGLVTYLILFAAGCAFLVSLFAGRPDVFGRFSGYAIGNGMGNAFAHGAAWMAAGAIAFAALFLLLLLVSFLLGMGQLKMLFYVCRGGKARITDLFYAFQKGSHPLRFLAALLLVMLRLLLLIAASAIVTALIFTLLIPGGTLDGMMPFSAILFLGLLLLLSLLFVYPVSYAPFALVDQPQLSVKEAFRLSRKSLKGRVLRLFWLTTFSFLLWQFFAQLTFGLIWLWVYPYMLCTLILYYLDGLSKETKTNAENSQQTFHRFDEMRQENENPHESETKTVSGTVSADDANRLIEKQDGNPEAEEQGSSSASEKLDDNPASKDALTQPDEPENQLENAPEPDASNKESTKQTEDSEKQGTTEEKLANIPEKPEVPQKSSMALLPGEEKAHECWEKAAREAGILTPEGTFRAIIKDGNKNEM